MDELAPITWLIAEINAVVSTGVSSISTSIAEKVAPVAASCFGIYVILVMVGFLRGSIAEPVMELGIRFAGLAVVIGLGLNAANYNSYVVPIVTGLGSDLGSAVSGSGASSSTLDELALHYFKILDEGYESADSPTFPLNVGPLILYVLKAFLILIGLVPFLVAATIMLVLADIGAVLVASVGPLFFAALIFPATRAYFSAWVNAALSYALVPLFVAVIAVISISLSKKMFLGSGGTLDDVALKTVFLASMGNLVLVVILRTVGTLAASLSAGGINVGVAGGVGSLASGLRNFGKGSAREIASMHQGYQGAKDVAGRVGAAISNRFNSIRKAG